MPPCAGPPIPTSRLSLHHPLTFTGSFWLTALSFAFPDTEHGACEVQLAPFGPVGEGPEGTTGGVHGRMGMIPVAIDDDEGEEGQRLSHGLAGVQPCGGIDTELPQDQGDGLCCHSSLI